jgi:hypothetical protein
MNKILGIVLGVIIGIVALVLIIIVVIILWILPAINQNSSSQTTTPAFTTTPTTLSTTIAKTTTANQTTAPAANDVSFSINITEISGTGLSRTITSQIRNDGSIDAQNCQARIEVFSGGNRIKISGQDFLIHPLGTLKAKVITTTRVTLSFSVFDAPLILANGATFNLTISSDQKTQTFSYDYTP